MAAKLHLRNHWTDRDKNDTIRFSISDFISRLKFGDSESSFWPWKIKKHIYPIAAKLHLRNHWTDRDQSDTIRFSVCDFISRLTVGDLRLSPYPFTAQKPISLLQPSYNSVTAGPIFKPKTPFDSAYPISSAVWNRITLGLWNTLQNGRKPISLWQPRRISKTTGQIVTKIAPFDSAYAISSAIQKLVTLGHRYDLENH